MRKGFSLIEVLVVIIILPFVTIALSQIFATFIRDIPRMTRVVEQNTTVLDMVGQLHRDLDGAVDLPDRFEAKRCDDDTLLIERQGDVIWYQKREGEVARTVAGRNGTAHDVRTWAFPEAVVSWRPWKDGGSAEAVEIRTLLRLRIGSKLKDKMVNSYVLFLGVSRKDGESG